MVDFNVGTVMDHAAYSEQDLKNYEELAKNSQAMEVKTESSHKQDELKTYSRHVTVVKEYEKIGRNDQCPCGSGKKYKNCCLKSGKYEKHHVLSPLEMAKVRCNQISTGSLKRNAYVEVASNKAKELVK